MANVKFFSGETVPLEMHKVKVIQKMELKPIERRREAILEAGFNTFLLQNCDVFMDMLTDSGVNAMSDKQVASMLVADDAYAGSATFTRLESKLRELFGKHYFLPAHQGRACENILSQGLIKPGNVIPMNFHFTTAKSHITLNGGIVEEVVIDEGLKPTSTFPFKGNTDIAKLRATIERTGADNVPFVRLEAGTNLIGGQPFSLANMREVRAVCDEYGIRLLLDASLMADNLYFIKEREADCKHMSIREIAREMCDLSDIFYFSGRKLGFGRGGGICTSDTWVYEKLREFVPLYEGFLTYGGMSVREMEALVVGMDETMDEDVISQGPQFIAYMCEELQRHGIPVITPPGGLGCHLNAMEFVDHLPQNEYPAGALAAALYLVSGVRGMERGTLSEQRNPDGSERFSEMELVRLAMPRRVFTMSQVKYAVDRIVWLYGHRRMIGGLRFDFEPKIMRFFIGRLVSLGDWPDALLAQFRKEFGDSL